MHVAASPGPTQLFRVVPTRHVDVQVVGEADEALRELLPAPGRSGGSVSSNHFRPCAGRSSSRIMPPRGWKGGRLRTRVRRKRRRRRLRRRLHVAGGKGRRRDSSARGPCTGGGVRSIPDGSGKDRTPPGPQGRWSWRSNNPLGPRSRSLRSHTRWTTDGTGSCRSKLHRVRGSWRSNESTPPARAFARPFGREHVSRCGRKRAHGARLRAGARTGGVWASDAAKWPRRRRSG